MENIVFKDIRFFDVPKDYIPTYIKSVDYDDKDYCVTDVKIENVTFDGIPFSKEQLLTVGNVMNIGIIY